MKLVLLMIRDEDKEKVLNELIENGYTPTHVASTGEFLQFGKSIFLLGIEEKQVDALKKIVDLNTKNASIKGGEQLRAQFYVVDARVEKLPF